MTFFVHGLLNNFSETDKASVPLWGYIAMVVALDLYHTHKGETSGSKINKEAEESEKSISE